MRAIDGGPICFRILESSISGTKRDLVGRLYFKTLPHLAARRARRSQDPEGGVLWDAYLLYRSDARWDDQPPDVVSWGSTILLTRDTLSRDLFGLLARPH